MSLKGFHENIEKSKEKINILDKYNRVARAYEEKIPQNPAEETRQSLEENEILLNLVKEDFLPQKNSSDYQEKAEKLKKFVEPVLNPRMRKTFLKKRRNSKPPARIGSLIAQQQINSRVMAK